MNLSCYRLLGGVLLLLGAARCHAVQIVGVSTQLMRGDDPIGAAMACQADFGAGSRACQSKDLLAPTSVTGLPAPANPTTEIYFRPTVVGVAGATTVTGMDTLGLKVYPDSGLPACSIYQHRAGQAPLYFAAADCSTPKRIMCCRD